MNVIWGSIIAWYLFLAGLAAGAFATAALVSFKNRKLVKVQLVGRTIALLALAIGLFLLMFDAEAGFKNPLRFFYLLTNFGSVMTWGTLILGVFGCVCLVTLLLALLKKKVPRALDGLGIFMAICTAAYTGVLLGVIKTYPLWNTALLPVLFLVSALSAGMAGTFIISTFVAHKELEQLDMLKRLHFALPLVELALLAILLYMTASAAPAARLSVDRLISGDLAPSFWLGLVIIGLIIPLIAGGIGSLVKGGRRMEMREDAQVAPKSEAEAGSVAGVVAVVGSRAGAVAGSESDAEAVVEAKSVAGAVTESESRAEAVGSGALGATRVIDAAGDAGSLVGGFLLRYLIIVAAVPLTFIF
ncbi:MAG: polysulfide reductase NrfD [Coriobacteriales bacterium]|jgi:formate-dependent nitrite reductase membrane component NrfD|nr:polysulfide reductase NrfD [Coriobacteriales bacterium]